MQQTGDEDYQESGDQPGDDDPHGKRCKIDGMETSKIACPFLKHDYNTFIHRRTCAGPGFDGMHRMKEHLKRKHFREHGCQRFGSYFQSNRMLQEHLRAPVPCPLTEVQQEPGFITQLQWDDINHKRQGNRTNVSERWKETYLILFPDTAKASIPSPYYEPSEFPNSPPNSCKRPQYDAFLRKHLPARVLLRLEAEFQSISDQVKQRLPSIVEQELTEALKVCMRGGDLREPATPAPAIASTSSLALPMFDAGLFQGINGFDGQWQAPYGLGCGGMSDWEFGSFPQYGAEGEKIDEGSGQRHVLRAKANIRDTHRLQVSSQESGIDAKKLSLPRIVDVGNDSRSSFSSPQRLSSSSKEKSMESTPCTRPSTGTESPSDGSTPSLSNNSEDNLTTAILANYATEQIATDVTRYFMEIVRSKFGFRQRGPSSSQEQHRSSGQPSQPSQDICREASQRGRQCLSNDRKRPRQSNGDDEDSDRAPDDKTPESKRRKFAEADKPKIACPFMKHSPTEFSAWRTCIGPGFDGMNRMKEHLKRRHFMDHTCQRCGVQFGSNRTLQDHLRALQPCLLGDAQPGKGFLTSVQWADIQAKRGRSSVEERWEEIYLIIFPKAEQESIPTPYFEAFEVSNNLTARLNPEKFEVYLKAQLPPRVLLRLKEDLDVFSEMVQQKLATIVQEELTETLKAYMRQNGGDQLGNFGSPDVALVETAMNDVSVDGMLDSFGGAQPFDFEIPTSWEDWQFSIS
ncbi:hypothetical protein CcaCcLH18_12448 [Colletotrichum camelliae]|nr:hypothetical protein CcaCcLH18_12448 [Colletotrichum camelliae]